MTDKIDHYNCEDCTLSELSGVEAYIHESVSDHTVVPVYV